MAFTSERYLRGMMSSTTDATETADFALKAAHKAHPSVCGCERLITVKKFPGPALGSGMVVV